VPRMFHKKLFIGALLMAGSPLLQAAEPDPVLVATPRAKVLATTASSRPFLAAARSQQPVDLAARGYVESEVAVRGHSNASQPYVTRMLVRRPLDARNFSGRVIVELLDSSGLHESAPLWGFSWEYFLRRGDAWVGVTVSPASADTLKKFNASRYGTLNLATGEAVGCGAVQQGGSASGDVIAQAGALLRSSSKENPLLGLNPQRLIAAGYSAGGDSITRFAAAMHRGMRLGDGGPIFDGYLNVSGLAAVSPACVAAGLPRGVPFVSVLTGMDIARVPDRDGGDAQSEGLRVFEVAGADGARPLPAAAPVAADLVSAGIAVPTTAVCREPLMDQTLTQALNAVWQQIDDLLVLRLPMENLPQIESAPLGGTSGGWRLPPVDLPLAGLVPGRPLVSTPPVAPRVCSAATGSMPRFDAATLRQLYRNRSEYLRQFHAAVDQAVVNRLLVKEDGDALKAAAVRTTPTF
jgi:hypothetical protein